jgi:hypothetical protein
MIVNGLKDNAAFNRVIERYKETAKSIDNIWHLTTDDSKLQTLRITKLATVDLINFLPNMQLDLRKLQDELTNIDNPDDIIHKDVDNG